ncbi:MAG TPA: dTMP kinase [Candidatus Baltobacteraceae bacterium]|nr:dTMP kinase [Candidatus Baltobacteraceae bacterium]
MFVTIEGIEGSGKSTLLAGLAGALRSEGCEPLMTREPGGTPVGDAIRGIFLDRSIAISPLTEALLVNAARAEHVAGTIRPALAAGTVVLCDRFVDSTLAYQGYGRGLDLELLRRLCSIATGGLEPDLTLLIDVSVGVSRDRTRARVHADRVESEDDAFHQRVRAGFLELARTSPRHHVLDGALAEAALLDQAWNAIAPLRASAP